MSRPVLLVSHGFQPNYEKAFANGLARNGLSVTVVTSDRSLINDFEKEIHIVPLRGSQNPQRSTWKKIWGLLLYVARLYAFLGTYRHSALHLIGIFITASVPLGLVEILGYRLLSRRLLLTVHNLLPHDRRSGLNRAILKLIYRIPNKLVVHTSKMRDALVNEWGISPGRIVQMEHGVDDLPEVARAWKPDPEGRLRLLMFGAISRYKGIDIALVALRDFTDFPISLVIAGECRDPTLAGELDQLIRHTPAMHRVEWRRGFVAEADVQGIFERADAVLLPYRHIDQSGVLLTAYRFGIPVLAFDVGSFARYVTAQTGVVIADRTPSGLQAGWRVMQSRVAQLDREAIRSVARQYLWEQTVRVLLPHY